MTRKYKIPKIWEQIAGFKPPKQTPSKYPRAKRTRAELIEYAKSLGLEIKFDYYKSGVHSVWDSNDSINHQYGPCDWLHNLYDIEYVLEDYASKHYASVTAPNKATGESTPLTWGDIFNTIENAKNDTK